MTPHIWARFAQPSRLIYARDEQITKDMAAYCAQAVNQFHRLAIPFCDANIQSAKDIWRAGLTKTYGLELRSERANRPGLIFDAAPDNFTARTQFWLEDIGETAFKDIQKTAWRKRFVTAISKPLIKLTGFLRVMKSATTFDGGVDYALWKVKRHSGVEITPTDFQRKYPLIAGWPILWKLWRKGALR